MTPEKKVQNDIISYLKSLDVFYERRQAGGFSYKKGIPDLYFVYNGQHVEVEVKKDGGSLSVMQEKFRDMCKDKSIKWACVSSLEEFKIFIKQL